MDKPRLRPPAGECHPERVDDELGLEIVSH
jgi:hypothetical protein